VNRPARKTEQTATREMCGFIGAPTAAPVAGQGQTAIAGIAHHLGPKSVPV
jgi:hypothetical protein